MFGESIAAEVKTAAEAAIDGASRILVIGSSLATYSAWRLARRARDRGMPMGVLNIGGVRGEEAFYEGLGEGNTGEEGVRCSERADLLLPELVDRMRGARSVERKEDGERQVETSLGRME